MIKIITSKGSFYDEIMAEHAQRLRNFEMTGHDKTDVELMKWTGINRPADQPMEIHGIYPTVFSYNNQIHYTTVVCYETKAEEAAEAKAEYSGM